MAFMQVLLEATPCYSVAPCALCRLRKWAPHAKLVYTMREPLSRALSHFTHCQRAHPGCLGNATSFQTFVMAELQAGTPLQCVVSAVNSMHINSMAELARTATSFSEASYSKPHLPHRRRMATFQDVHADGAAVLRHWQRCYTGCAYENLKDGMRCPGLHQDLPVSRGLYWYQLLVMQAMFPGQVLVINYHHLMKNPSKEVSRILNFVNQTHNTGNNSTEDAAKFLMQYHDDVSYIDTGLYKDDKQRVEGVGKDDMGWLQHGASDTGKSTIFSNQTQALHVQQQKQHSEQMLRHAKSSLHRLQKLYARANTGLLHMLKNIGQTHALHNSTSVFPDPSFDLQVQPASQGTGDT